MDFDNLFDEALSDADDRILDAMGKNILVFIHGVATPVRAVFDEPAANITLPHGAAVIDDVAPTLFVKTAAVSGLKRRDEVRVGADIYWVAQILPDDLGACVIRLDRGRPGEPAPAIPTAWSKP